MIKDKNLESRILTATTFFEQGFNCSQAVFMAYADLYDIDQQTAAKMATSFGGGMGRLREVCGAVSGMFLVLGFQYPAIDVNDKAAKTANYAAVQRTAKAFKAEMGSYICADLLRLKREPQGVTPSERNEKYYSERPCTRCVALAAKILAAEIG